MKYLNLISKAIANITEKLILVMFTLMFVMLISQVLFRYVFNMPLGWTEELLRYSMTWVVFLGASVASYNRSHLGVTILQEYAPLKLKIILDIFLGIIIGIFLAVIVFYAFDLVGKVQRTKSPVLQMSMSIPYYSVVIGGILMLVHTCISIIKDLFQLKEEMFRKN